MKTGQINFFLSLLAHSIHANCIKFLLTYIFLLDAVHPRQDGCRALQRLLTVLLVACEPFLSNFTMLSRQLLDCLSLYLFPLSVGAKNLWVHPMRQMDLAEALMKYAINEVELFFFFFFSIFPLQLDVFKI